MRKTLTACSLIVLLFISTTPLTAREFKSTRWNAEPTIGPIRNQVDSEDAEQIDLAHNLKLAIDIGVAPGGNVQAAVNLATFGDKIILQAGATYETPADFVSITLPNKGSGSEFITITSSIPAPPDGTRVTLADRANMPKLVVKGGSPFFEALAGAHHYRLSNLWVTNKEGGTTSQLLANNGFDITHPDPRDPQVDWPHDIVMDHLWLNPVEWDQFPEANLCSSVNSPIAIVGINVTIRDSVMKGFGAKYTNGTAANLPACGEGKDVLDGQSVAIGTAPGPMLVDNNHMEEWFVAYMVGGADPGSMFGSRVLSSPMPTLTSATMENVNGLSVGMKISFEMNAESPTHPGVTVGAGTVTSISGSSITFTPLVGLWGPDDNYSAISSGFRPKTVNDSGGVPPCTVDFKDQPIWCSQALWNGYVPSNINVTRNYINKPIRWYNYVGSDGKGFFEYKLCDTCLFDGNIVDGNTGFTVTVRNQGGRAPWSVIKNLTISNNLAIRFSAGLYTLFQDNQQLSEECSDINFLNNLMYGEFDNSGGAGFLPQIFRGSHGKRVRFDHNTILQSGRIMAYGNDASQAGIDELTGFQYTNNITNWGHRPTQQIGYACFSGPLQTCTPNFVWTRSVMIGAPPGPLSDEQSLADFPSGNFNPATIADVGFTDPANGDFRLLPSSPFKNAGTDGKDPGVDMDQLLAHLNGPIPVPSPTPSSTAPPPTPSPTASPSPEPGTGRIAISADGNNHDCDDITSTAMTVALLAQTGNASKLVYYGYADHVWSSGTSFESCSGIADREEAMRVSAEETAKMWDGFNMGAFVNARANTGDAVDALASQINASSADNPLSIIAAGPMEVIGRALTASNSNKQFVTVVSHSEWNDRHADDPEGGEELHSGWTWAEMQSAFPAVTFTHIADQNTGLLTDESNFHWLLNSYDPRLTWLWDRHQASGKGVFDTSDTGMLYYLLTGDQGATPRKLRFLLEPNVYPGISWDVATPAEVAFDPDMFAQALAECPDKTIVIKNGYVVGTKGNVSTTGYIWSANKALISLVFGSLLQRGAIGYDQLVPGSDFPTAPFATNRQILSMSSDYGLSPHSPGNFHAYNNGAYDHLGRQLNTIFFPGRTPEQMLWESFVGALGFQDPLGYNTAGFFSGWDGGYSMSTQDMGRIGYLVLRNGNWKGQQLISAAHIDSLYFNQIPIGSIFNPDTHDQFYNQSEVIGPGALPGNFSYGFWLNLTNGPDITMAGAFGTRVYISRQHNLVIAHVNTGGTDTNPGPTISPAQFDAFIAALGAQPQPSPTPTPTPTPTSTPTPTPTATPTPEPTATPTPSPTPLPTPSPSPTPGCLRFNPKGKCVKRLR